MDQVLNHIKIGVRPLPEVETHDVAGLIAGIQEFRHYTFVSKKTSYSRLVCFIPRRLATQSRSDHHLAAVKPAGFLHG